MNLKKAVMTLLVLWTCTLSWIPAAKAAAPEVSITPAQLEQTIDSVVLNGMETAHIPGTAVVVTIGDEIIFSKGYGYADVERQIPVNPQQTIMRIGSLTKTLTATAVMQLKERGKLALDQDVGTYLTAFKVPSYRNQPITLQHLLTHTAGLDEAIYELAAASESRAMSADQYLRRYFAMQPPIREPGTEFAYSNAGLGLAGVVVEQIAGSTLSDYMSHNLFEPLDMPSATFSVRENDPNMAKSYVYHDGNYVQIPYSYLNLPGSGVLSVVPNEWAHFMLAQLNGGLYAGQRITADATIEEMHARQFSEHPDMEGVGYGFFRDRLPNGMLILWHLGNVDGFSAKMQLIPAQKLGIFVISNATASGTQLTDLVTDAITGLLPAAQTQPAAEIAASVNLEQYVRNYTLGLSPRHGWGKWFKWLGGRNFEVRSAGDILEITGVFPDGSGMEQTRGYLPLNSGLFKNRENGEYIRLHQQEGKWKMTFTHGVTINEQPPFLQRPSTLMTVYAGFALLWFALFVIGLARYVLRLFMRKQSNKLGSIFLVASIYIVYTVGQLLYGNSEIITRGYPAWYAWGFSSLPFLAAAIAIYAVIRSFRSCDLSKMANERLHRYSHSLIALMALSHLYFLFYWNMLSIHYS
ncbi:MAG: serine hydrolase domain-containing protein [Candidatus Pristimantibacillus sp.]